MPQTPNLYRIAVLLCDTPIEPIVKMQGDYGDIFRALFRNTLQSIKSNIAKPETTSIGDEDFIVDPFDVRIKLEYPEDVDKYDAVLLTGSAASAYENVEWINRLVRYVQFLSKERPNIRLIGICFGHQIIARALGGECVLSDKGWEVGVTKIDLTDIGKKLFGVPELNIQQMHRDHVPTIPPSFHLLGSSPITPNQGMVKLYPNAESESLTPKDVHIFTVQGHPEFNKRITEEIVKARSSKGVMSQEIVDDNQRRADWRNDGVSVIGKTLWEILRGARV